MSIKELWEELDMVWSIPEEMPKPEGKEISEEDFDRIREEWEDDDR